MEIKDFLNKGDVFAARAGVQLTEVNEGYARAEMVVTEAHLNAGGVCQGGAIFTLADLAIAAVLILIALVITLVVSISSGKGKKLARNTAEYLGKTVAVAESKLDVHFKDKSAFSVLNKALEFDYVEESEDSVKVDGTKYPEWAVLVKVNKQQQIQSVKYCDFKLLKKDVRGVECDKIINLDRFDEGADYSKVNSEIGIDPYSISYSEKLVTYRYRYWFENDSGDQQQVVLDVSYDNDNHFLYYTSNMVYPENL